MIRRGILLSNAHTVVLAQKGRQDNEGLYESCESRGFQTVYWDPTSAIQY
jgi:hypothetical protein